MACFDDLPEPLVLAIIQNVPPPERRLLAPVCRQFEQVVRGLQSKLVIDFSKHPGGHVHTDAQAARSLLQAVANRGKQVTELAVCGGGVSGRRNCRHRRQHELVAELAAFLTSSLTKLSLDRCCPPPDHELPQWVPRLASLECLELKQCDDPCCLEALLRLTSLTALSFTLCGYGYYTDPLEVPDGITQLTRLHRLGFDDSPTTGRLDLLGQLPALRELRFHNSLCKGGLEWLQGLTQLSFLHFGGLGEIASERPGEGELDEALAPLTQLQHLKLIVNALENVPACVRGMTHLHSLSLAFNDMSTLPSGPYLAGLERLDIACTWITELPVAELAQLSCLYLSIAEAPPIVPSPAAQARQWAQQLAHLPRLRRVELWTDESEELELLLRRQLPDVVVGGHTDEEL